MFIENDQDAAALVMFASDLMDEHDWTRGRYYSKPVVLPVPADGWTGGAMCTEGALMAADRLIYGLTGEDQHTPVFTRALQAVVERVPGGRASERILWSIPKWNDEACTSKEQAVTFLRDVAVKIAPDSATWTKQVDA